MKKCECDINAKLYPEMKDMFNPDTELPYVNHKPNKCKCTNNLKKYKRGDRIITLCSNCNQWFDEEINEKS